MSQPPLTLKGTPQGLRLQPKSESWDEVLTALKQSLHEAGGFFKGGRVLLELTTTQSLDAQAFEALQQLLGHYELYLEGILGGDQATQHLARTHGLLTRLPVPVSVEPAAPPESNAQFIQRTLRSGQQINSPGHIVIVGDINPGAEVIAGGNIIIWGHVRGIVHAGAVGNTAAIVCALDLNPAQLRIAGLITRAPEDTAQRLPRPEIASIRDGDIIVEPWIA